MSLTIKVKNDAFPDGHVFSIEHLGSFENGKSREVEKDNEQAFVDDRGISVRDALANDASLEVTGTATAKVPDPEPDEETAPTTETEEGGAK